MTRMKRILEVDTDNRLAVVEPGVINLELDLHVRKYGLRYARDPFTSEDMETMKRVRNAFSPSATFIPRQDSPRTMDAAKWQLGGGLRA